MPLVSVERPASSRLKTYSDRTYVHTTLVRHQGTTVALALDSTRRIFYSVLDLNSTATAPKGDDEAGAADLDVYHWSEDPKELAFPRELTRAGFALLGSDRLPRVRRGGRMEEGPDDIFRDEEVDPFLSSTARLTAAEVPFQAVSDGKHVFVFRQAVAAGDADALVRTGTGTLAGTGAAGTSAAGTGAAGTAVAPGALLCDRFVLAGGELRPVMEVRYRRSRHRTRPDSVKDGLGIKDMDGVPFHEPTLELGFAGRPEAGRFAVLLVPTGIAGTSRWQFFVHNTVSKSIDAINVEQGEDGLFHTQGSRLWTSPDRQYRDSVLERTPGACPFTQRPLVPVTSSEEFAESALSLPGTTGKGYGEAAAPAGFGSAAYTVEAWVKPEAAGGTLLSTGATGVTWSVSSKGALVLAHGAASVTTADALVKPGVYTHVAAVFGGGKATLLVNGAEVCTGDLAAAAAPAKNGKVLLGATSATAGHFAGVLDEIRVWSRARRLRRVAESSGERLVGDEPQLVAYYRFDEGVGTTAYDQSSSAAHATLKGTVTWVTSDAPIADHPGIRRDSFRVSGRTVIGGLAAVLHHQQEEGLVAGGAIRPLKRQARVLLAWTASATTGSNGRIAALDVAVAQDGRLAQLTDVIDLPVIGTSVEAVNPDEQNQLKADVVRDKELREKARQGKAQLESDRDNPWALQQVLTAALDPACMTSGNAGSQGTTCVVYVPTRLGALRHLTVISDGKGGHLPTLANGAPAAGDTASQWVFNGSTFKSVKADKTLTGQGRHQDIVLGVGGGLRPSPSNPFGSGGGQILVGGSMEYAVWSGGRLKVLDTYLDGGEQLTFYPIAVSPTGDDQIKKTADATAALDRVTAVAGAEAAFKAWDAKITALTTAIETNEEKLGRISAFTTGRSDRALPMAQIGQDRLGLGWSGALLDFAVTSGSPHLAESGTGHLGLYYRDEHEQLTSLFYNTHIDRSTKKVAASDGTSVLLTARDAGVDLADATIAVAAEDTAERCKLTLTLKGGDTETWSLLPRAAEGFAAALNGMRDLPLPVGAVSTFKDGVLTLAAPGTPCAIAAGDLISVGGTVYVLSEAVEEKATELRLNYGPADAKIAAKTAVRRLSYEPGLVTHTRPGASAVYGSRYVSASVVSTTGATTGSVSDGAAALDGQARPPRWWGDLPGRALTFAATTTAPTLAAAKLASARHADDLTIEAWLNPAAGSTAEDTPRMLHVNTGTEKEDSQYALALGATIDKKAEGERPLIMGVGNRFVTSRASIPAGRWTHVAGAFEQSWALRFTSGVHAETPHADDLNIGRDLTLEMFLQADALTSAQGLLSKGRIDDGHGRRVPYQLGVAADGKLVFSFEDRDGKQVKLTSTGKITKGTFHRIAVVRKLGDTREEKTGERKLAVTDAAGKAAELVVNAIESLVVRQWSDITFYIDGAEAGNIRYADAPDLGHPGALEIGRTRCGAVQESFTGVISEVRVWNTARQAKDLGIDLPNADQAPANGGVDSRTRPQGLIAHWRFEEKAGNTAKDEAGSHPARVNGKQWTKNPDPKGSRFHLYIDGVATQATPLDADKAPSQGGYGSAQFTLGGRIDGTSTQDRYLGVLEEVRIWHSARSEEQILDNLFGRLTGDSADLLGHYPFDDESTEADAAELRDHGPSRLHLPLSTDSAARPQPLMSTAPISSETPEVRPAFATGQPRFVQTIAGTPAVSEYADLQRLKDRSTRGVLKRAYAYLQDGDWNLITGYKLGDLETEWVSQVQFAPQLIGYIEGAPPVPAENLIATRRPSSLSYINTTSVEFQQADQVVQTLSSGGEKTIDASLAMRFSNNADADTLMIAAPLGFGTATPIVDFNVNANIGTTLEYSNGWGNQTDVSEGLDTGRSTTIGLSGGWETEQADKQVNAEGGRRFLPSNTGYALVQSETADVFALRVAHSGAVVAYRMLPNPDIPRDWNLLPFAINPRYVKQGVLDGMTGYSATKGKILDASYPNARDYGEYSYFKPSEATALKRRITEDMQRRQAFYAGVSNETHDAASHPAETRAKELVSRFTGPIPGPGTDTGDKKKDAEGFSRRDIVNTYVWTADGGFFAETTATTDTVTETTSGSYRFNGAVTGGLDFGVKVFGVGIGFQMDAALGGGFSHTRSKSKESTRAFSLNVHVDTPGDMQEYNDQSVPQFNTDGTPKEVPGRVDAYRFMTFYLDSDKSNFEDFYGKVVDPRWLASDDPNALALSQSNQAAQKPPCWRVLHRVTFVSRKLPSDLAAPGTDLEKDMRKVDVSSNYELLRRLEPYVDPSVPDRDTLATQVEAAITAQLPALSAHTATITDFFAGYYGIA